MASSCKETSLPVESSCISQSFTGGDKGVRGDEKIQIQDQSRAENPKINRLKRVKKSKKSDLMLRECKVVRPEVTDDDHHLHHHHEKRSHTSTTKNTRPPSTPGAQCSPSKRGLHPFFLHMNVSVGQNKREMKSEGTASSHEQPSVLADEAGSLSRRGSREREESESENSAAFMSYSTSASRGARSSTEFFKNSRSFPVRRLFQTLLNVRRGEGEGAPVVPVAGKRKQEVESHSDGRLRKRQRSSQDDAETVNRSEGRVSSREGARSRNRLRRKQPHVQDAAVDESHQDEGRGDDAGRGDDVPWTEKYRPRSCDEVIGNSAAVRKLYSWLKEWRIRADVEERRKRREERRMKEESDGSWDCGDFEGDPLTEEREDALCNTLLIHGPTGAGKSAAVFACAEQLGFNVLEVNSSSLRSGRLVLSQLRESTQSHQVGAPPQTQTRTQTWRSVPLSREEAPQKSVSSCRKPPAISRAASGKKRGAAQKSVTLTRYFRKTEKLENKHSEPPQDTRGEEAPQKSVSSCRKPPAISRAASGKKRGAAQKSVTLTRYFRKTEKLENKHSEPPQDTRGEEAPQKSVSSCRKPPAISRAASGKKRGAAQKSVTLTRYFRKTEKLENKHSEPPQDTRAADEVTLDESEFKKDIKDKTPPISLILFEEVDIIFEEDVGFLAAVKSLMSTTKRPIILTTNDPSFGESFDGRFEEIRFRTPATESVVSYLQCVCAVRSVKPDPEHIRFVVRENNGDVRRSLLELEVWARSGAGNTHHHLRNRALACRSYAELESSRCVEALEESWKKGRSLLHSNLGLLLAPPTIEKSDQSTFDQNTIFTFQNDANKNPSPCGKLPNPENFQSGKRSREMKHSESELLLDRFKPMNQSAAEAHLSEVSSLGHFCDTVSFVDSYLSPRQPSCKSGPLGAKMADGLLDEPREEEEEEAEDAAMRTRRLERCYEVMAVVEGLGFHRCRMEVRPAKRGDRDETGRDKNETWRLSEQKSDEIVRKVLRSKAFRYHGNRTAVLTDYLPCLRFICRAQDAEQQPDLRFSHYLSDIGLRLRKSDVLASQLH